jgi:hypothetical protein
MNVDGVMNRSNYVYYILSSVLSYSSRRNWLFPEGGSWIIVSSELHCFWHAYSRVPLGAFIGGLISARWVLWVQRPATKQCSIHRVIVVTHNHCNWWLNSKIVELPYYLIVPTPAWKTYTIHRTNPESDLMLLIPDDMAVLRSYTKLA